MNPLAAITALFEALAAAARAFPIWVARTNIKDIERQQQAILKHEIAGTPADRRAADLLRSQVAYRSRLHAALLPGHLWKSRRGRRSKPNKGCIAPKWMSAGIPPIST